MHAARVNICIWWRVTLTIAKILRVAFLLPASLEFKSLTPPTTHTQFDSKAHHAEAKFEKGASDRNSSTGHAWRLRDTHKADCVHGHPKLVVV